MFKKGALKVKFVGNVLLMKLFDKSTLDNEVEDQKHEGKVVSALLFKYS
jgi:hypothetical protein